MAGYIQLSSLLSGPTTHIEHDEAGDGSFKDLTGSLPLSMLTYFSSTIRDEHRVSIPPPPPSWAPQAHETWYEGHRQSHSYYMCSVSAPTRIRLIGGDPTAHLDVIHWMTTCCHQNTIIPLSTIIASPTRFILAMTSIRILGITTLDDELPHLIQRLGNEMLDIDTAGRVFASGDNIIPEVRRAICTCVAGYFFAGRLQDVDRWMYLGKMNRRFDEGVWKVLDETRDGAKLEIWKRKDAQRYSSSTNIHEGRQHQGVSEEQEYRMPGGYPPSSVRVDQFQSRPPVPLPPPPPPTIPQNGYWHQHSQPPDRPPEHNAMPPRMMSYPPSGELHPVARSGTPSLSSSPSRSPSPRTRRVHFSDRPRAPRVPTPPPAAWAPFNTQQLASHHAYCPPRVEPHYQQPFYPSYGTPFPCQGPTQPPYLPSRSSEYYYEPHGHGEYFRRHY